jgi:hypothetical protein
MRTWYGNDDELNACEALFKMSGKRVRVRKDLANAALDYEDIFPDDLGPLLVLDASGQQRKVYEFWHADRKGLSFLRSPQKDYSGLTIHHWKRGAGQKARKEDGALIADGIAKTIEAIPADEPILVVHFKQKSRNDVDWQEAMRSRIRRGNVSFCTWGRHTATNEFQDCRHVILVGILQYSTSQHEAIARGAKGLAVEEELSDHDFEETRLGEIAHNIFQAACRGMVRKSVGDGCPQGCHLYVIFSTQKGTGFPQALLSRLFPGAAIKDWRPVIEPKGRAKELLRHLTATPPGKSVSKAELMDRMGFSHSSQLNRLLRHPDVQGVLENEGSRLEIGRKEVTVRLAAKLLPF